VAGGGRILATGDTSLWDEKGVKRTDFALADVLGISLVGEVEGPIAMERPEEPQPACGAFCQIKCAGRVISRRIETDPAGPVGGGNDPLPVGEPTWPLFATHNLGKGVAGYVAFDIGHYYTLHGDDHIGLLMAEVLNTVLPERQMTVKAPLSVEVTLWEQPDKKRTIIHVANRTVQWSLPTMEREIREIVPVHDIEISLPCLSSNPKVTARHTDVAVEEIGGRLVMKLGKVDDYAAIVIEQD
jgi:hypothetical protein